MTEDAFTRIAGQGNGSGGILIVADHASARVPADIDLGIDPAVLTRHVAVDIGVAPLAAALVDALDRDGPDHDGPGCDAILGGVSRLVCDCNRDEDAPGLIPLESDGIEIPGNRLDAAGRAGRIARIFQPYHAAVAAEIERVRPALLVSLHSFTPRLETQPEVARPWQIGILYNQDERAARLAIPMLNAVGIVTGDNEPYSGRVLNATMNRHGEARGLPYLGIEVRQDLIADPEGVAAWCMRLAPVIASVRDNLAAEKA